MENKKILWAIFGLLSGVVVVAMVSLVLLLATKDDGPQEKPKAKKVSGSFGSIGKHIPKPPEQKTWEYAALFAKDAEVIGNFDAMGLRGWEALWCRRASAKKEIGKDTQFGYECLFKRPRKVKVVGVGK